MRASQVIPEARAGGPSSLWTLGRGGSAVWWIRNEEQRIQNFLVERFQSKPVLTPPHWHAHAGQGTIVSLLWYGLVD